MDDIISVSIITIGIYFSLLFTASILRPIVFFIEPIFRAINYLQWWLTNPARYFFRNKNSGKPRGFFIFLWITGVNIVWWILSYVATMPLRILTGVYYDILLFSAVSLADNIQELLNPKRGKLGHVKGWKRVSLIILTFPIRFIVFVLKGGLYIIDSFLMFGMSITFPTLTMLHGTDFKVAGTKVAQSNDWLVGSGNYAGTGIYFGIKEQTARHYAPSGSDCSIIICRVTLSFCKTISTLTQEDRGLVGLGDSGEMLAKRVASGFYSSVEHWRDGAWWEYCILKPGKMGSKVKSWRIRPIALIRDGSIERTWGGFAHYSLSAGLISGVIAWLLALYFFAFITGA